MKDILKIVVSLVFLIILSLKAEEKEKTFDLGETVITATKTPHILEETTGTVNVITKEEINSIKPFNISELIEKKCGLKINDYGWIGSSKSISLRGTTSSQVLVLIDGIPINLPSVGTPDLNTIPIESIEKVEIVRGPFSSLYGANALGGVINIITKKPEEKFTIEGNFSYGRWDTTKNYINFGKQDERFGYFISFGNIYTDGFRENSKDKSLDIFSKFIFKTPNDADLTISGSFNSDNYRVPGPITWSTPYASQKTDNKLLDLTYNLHNDFIFKTYWNTNVLNYKNEDPFWPTDDETTNNIFGIDFQKSFSLGERNLITFGWNYKYENVDVFDKINNQSRIGRERTRDNYGIFIQNETELEKFMLTIGLRWDDNSAYGSFLSPKISTLYKIKEKTNLRFSAGSSFRAPSFDDLYWYEDWGWGMGLFGNPDLKVEKGKTFDFGIEHLFNDNFLTRINVFYTKTKDLIKWTEVSNWRWEAKNIGRAEIKGAELEILLKPYKFFEIGMNYTYTDGKNEKQDKYLTYTPKNKISLTLNYKNDKGFKWCTDLNFVDKVYTDENNTKTLDDYFVVNTTISKEIGERYELFLKVNNLLDEKYQTIKDYPMPKRSVIGGVKIKF